MPVESRFVSVGKPAPEFSLPTISGETFNITQLQGRKIVILVFLRGFM
jgi:peroxiredoxin